MHDQLEGVLPLEIKLLLKKYIKEEEYITLGTLNERIRTFDYGPSDISLLANNSASLSRSAAEMWCLARTLPLLIEDVVPESDPHWEKFLCLFKIEEIVFSPASSTQLAAFPEVLVEQYLDDFVVDDDRGAASMEVESQGSLNSYILVILDLLR
ncbi:uncharacterized protein [Acropora muricata]|uniref:uncharacterized protein n=1 Tax=Acropora muricata TaxID=159855 RepID=UPI0034E52798